jgi:hypothetical protein
MKKKSILLSVILFLITLCITAQPTIEWQKSLGGTNKEIARCIQQTIDGGYIVAGQTLSNDGDVTSNHGDHDYWVVKFDSIGDITWQKTFGGSNEDIAYSIQQTTDGGYIVVGSSQSIDGDVTGNHGSSDFWVIKLTSLGVITWQKTFGGYSWDVGYSIQQTLDGGYIVAGSSLSNNGDVTGNHGNEDYWVVKINNLGDIEWQKSLGGSSSEHAYSIQQTSEGGYIVAGFTLSNDWDVTGNHSSLGDFWVVKINNLGNIEWQKSLGGTGSESAKQIQQTNDGGYIVAGWSNSNDGDVTGNQGEYDFWVVKLNDVGSIAWQKSIGGSGWELASSIQQTTDGGYIVAGSTTSNNGDVLGYIGGGDLWMVKLTSIGGILWQKCLGGTNNETAHSVRQTSDAGYIVTGTSNSNDGNVSGNHGNYDIWVVKLSAVIGVDEIVEQNLFSVFPNPATNQINVKIDAKLLGSVYTVYDNTGRKVLSGQLNTENTVIELGNLSGGMYLFSVGENMQQTFKVIKE